MTQKIGDAIIAIIILVFVVGGISLFINSADEETGFDSGTLGSSFQELDGALDNVDSSLVGGFTSKVDNSSSFVVGEGQQLDERGGDAGGLTNIVSKNILVKFFTSVSDKIPGSTRIMIYIGMVVAVVLSILLLRLILGDGKI